MVQAASNRERVPSQDMVSLVDPSRVVTCDCAGRNPRTDGKDSLDSANNAIE